MRRQMYPRIWNCAEDLRCREYQGVTQQYGLGVFTKDNFATIEDADNLVPWSTIGLDLK